MVSIRSVFRRLPSVTYSRGKYHVHGSDLELWRMCGVCLLALDKRGYNIKQMRRILWETWADNIMHTEEIDDEHEVNG